MRSPSGFLTNFDQLDDGYGTEDAVGSYLNPDMDARSYHSLMIDPVTTVIASSAVSPQVAEQLAANLQNAMHDEFKQHVPIVSVPGPGTLRLRAALTDVISGHHVVGSPVTTKHISPRETLTGKIGDQTLAAFITKVSFEGELVDSVTGKRLAALVDHRLGVKREATAATSWAAVRSAASVSAKKLAQRFMRARNP